MISASETRNPTDSVGRGKCDSRPLDPTRCQAQVSASETRNPTDSVGRAKCDSRPLDPTRCQAQVSASETHAHPGKMIDSEKLDYRRPTSSSQSQKTRPRRSQEHQCNTCLEQVRHALSPTCQTSTRRHQRSPRVGLGRVVPPGNLELSVALAEEQHALMLSCQTPTNRHQQRPRLASEE
jgi:hypothetical protein